ncbi:ferredoxin [Pseudonocardia sp. DSM 110487]|uniref:ferredoxin n=1 Tax=Pseudonocardia sp. DSM 110487 TaxID=2865833 RepID=UPI001C69B6A3|nr:ferredoxin [Pseudonocardia sp. DSM 110487]QYN33515.1 ferredoxin [Pseudonocardia sp. DSM 110487]
MSDRSEVLLDTDRCQAYGICVGILPDVIATPPGSPVAVLLGTHVDASDREDLAEAVRVCPAQALQIGQVQP